MKKYMRMKMRMEAECRRWEKYWCSGNVDRTENRGRKKKKARGSAGTDGESGDGWLVDGWTDGAK